MGEKHEGGSCGYSRRMKEGTEAPTTRQGVWGLVGTRRTESLTPDAGHLPGALSKWQSKALEEGSRRENAWWWGVPEGSDPTSKAPASWLLLLCIDSEVTQGLLSQIPTKVSPAEVGG